VEGRGKKDDIVRVCWMDGWDFSVWVLWDDKS
jgi:hypothetical protein